MLEGFKEGGLVSSIQSRGDLVFELKVLTWEEAAGRLSLSVWRSRDETRSQSPW
jgi:hypothetical protein